MALTTNIELETHGDGTVGLNGIVDGNWARLDAVFGAALSSGDTAYHAFWKALTRDNTQPTTAGANLEWDLANTKVRFLPGYSVATHATSFTPDASLGRWQRLDVTGTTNFQSLNNQAAGQVVTFALVCDGSTRNLSFPAGWVWMGGSEPANIAANKTGLLRLGTMGAADADVIADYVVES